MQSTIKIWGRSVFHYWNAARPRALKGKQRGGLAGNGTPWQADILSVLKAHLDQPGPSVVATTVRVETRVREEKERKKERRKKEKKKRKKEKEKKKRKKKEKERKRRKTKERRRRRKKRKKERQERRKRKKKERKKEKEKKKERRKKERKKERRKKERKKANELLMSPPAWQMKRFWKFYDFTLVLIYSKWASRLSLQITAGYEKHFKKMKCTTLHLCLNLNTSDF